MARTNYVLQFVAVDIVFGNYAFGARAVTPPSGVFAAFALFGTLVLMSNWWLTRFRLGRAERVLQSITYAQFQPLFRPVARTGRTVRGVGLTPAARVR